MRMPAIVTFKPLLLGTLDTEDAVELSFLAQKKLIDEFAKANDENTILPASSASPEKF